MCAMRNLSELSRSGMQACSQGDLLNADFLLSQALQQAIGMKSDVLEAKLRNNLGIVCRLSGRLNEAETHFITALHKLTARIGEKGALYQALRKNISELDGLKKAA